MLLVALDWPSANQQLVTHFSMLDPLSPHSRSTVEEWSGKTQFQVLPNGFKFTTMQRRIFRCSATLQEEKSEWVRYTTSWKAVGLLSHYCRHRSQRWRKPPQPLRHLLDASTQLKRSQKSRRSGHNREVRVARGLYLLSCESLTLKANRDTTLGPALQVHLYR